MTSEDQHRLPAGIYRQLFEYAADPILILDFAGNFIEANQAACDHLGYSREELLHMRPEHVDDAASRDKIPGRMAQLKRERQARFEAVHIHRNGTHIPVEMHIRLIEHEGKTLALNICRNITERKQREIEYRTIVQTTTDGFWIVSANDARILEANGAYCRMVGYTRDELLSMYVYDLEAAESPEEVKAYVRKALETGHDFFETKHWHKDGHIIEIEVSASYSNLRGGVFFSFMRDISERNRIENEMSLSRQAFAAEKALFQTILDNAPLGIWMVDVAGRVQFVNKTFCNATGISEQQFMRAAHYADVLPPSVSANCIRSDQGCIAQAEGPHFSSEWLPFVDGKDHLLEITKVKLLRQDGSIKGVIGLAADITEREKTETRLRDSEERFRRMYENAPIGIAMAGEDLKIFSANPAYCKLFGYTPEELRHLTIADLTHPDYLHQTSEKVAAVLGGTLPSYSFAKKYLRKDGGTFWGRITATEVMSGISGVRYIMGLVEDITERIEREERRLAEVREQKDILVREVHHRIKNNLQGVVGLLRQYATDHPEIIGVIDGAVGKIYSIAAIHGLQAQKLSEAVNLVSLVEQIVGSSECPVKLSNELSCPAILAKDEAVPVALILNELVTNACKHRSSARHSIIVNLGSNGTGVVITVANPFDGNGGGTAGQGSGLHLVESLLPRKYARLEFKQAEGVYFAMLELSPPIVISEK